jgi:RNA polymerase sigma-70 factor (ECF subfamily)
MLSCRVGMRHLDMVEDAVQCALLAALESWSTAGVPDNPSAWLFRVAHNHIVGELRQRTRRDHLMVQRGPDELEPTSFDLTAALAGDVGDELLRMLFVCCDDSIPMESQLVFALKTLCGFDVREMPSFSCRVR